MFIYTRLIALVLPTACFISCSNSQTDRINDTPKSKESDLDSITAIQPKNDKVNKSYDINGFMSFNNETSFELATSYFVNNDISFSKVNFLDNPPTNFTSDYYNNPQTQPSEYDKYQWPGSYFIFSDILLKREWPVGKIIFVPELWVEGLVIKHVLFAFHNNFLSFISFGTAEWDDIDFNSSVENYDCFFKLESLYKKKYGEGAFKEWGDNGSKWRQLTYHNYSKKIEVKFFNQFKVSGTQNQFKKSRLLFTIVFANYKDFINACKAYINDVHTREIKEKNDKEKRLLENL